MFRLHRLASEPECFTPIDFRSGLNLILGERSEDLDGQGAKVNGVGKSVCVETLHFALGREFAETRLSRIPPGVLPDGLVVTLDVTISGQRLQLRRSLHLPGMPEVVRSDGTTIAFANLDEQNQFLGELLFRGNKHAGQVSFRSVMAVLMRDERSEFKSCVNPHDQARKIPDQIEPHLYLLGIDGTAYVTLLRTISRLKKEQDVLRELRSIVTNRNTVKLSDIPAQLNEERQATKKIEEALSELKADPAFEAFEGTLNEIEIELKKLRGERKKLSFQIDQIRSIPLPQRIEVSDLRIVFERVKAGLGDLVEKSFEQATTFKAEIERFQQSLQQEELAELEARRAKLSSRIHEQSTRHAELTRRADKAGVLQELQVGFAVATRRSDDYQRLDAQFKQYGEKKKSVDFLKTERSKDLHRVNETLDRYDDVVSSFNETVVGLHEKIQQSSRASFAFSVNDKSTAKRPLSIELRIQDDGSHSIEKARVFIYDFALLLNEYSSPNHPGLLLHDNILEVDKDTLTRCLNFLSELANEREDFQYVLTLNRDDLAGEVAENIELDIEESKVASFTKQSQFLRKRYQEQATDWNIESRGTGLG